MEIGGDGLEQRWLACGLDLLQPLTRFRFIAQE
jgi:hypothetical protein